MNRKGVVIIDSDQDYRKMYGHLIESLSDLQLQNNYQSIEWALDRIGLDKPDLIIIGLDPDDYDQFKLMPKICKKSFAEIILIADFVENNLLHNAIGFGVCGFLLRSSSLSEIEEAIQVVSDGGGFLNNKIARKLLLSCRTNTSSPLTLRETEALNLLAAGKTYSLIAREMEIADGTAKIHIKNIYSKLQVTSKAAAILKAKEIQILSETF